MADKRKYVQGMKYRLYGSGIGSSDTSIRLTSMTLPNSGDLVTMTMFGDKGYATIEPGNRSREENISFTGITQNVDGSATLTGVTRGIELATTTNEYVQDLTQRKSHAGGVAISITNSSVFYGDFANKYNDETIVGKYTFPSSPGVDRPVIGADTNAVLAEELVTKGELNRAVTATFLTPTIITSSSATTGTSTAASLTWAHVSSGDNRLLTVQISTEEDKTITGVTYNGDALTQAASHTRVTGDLRTEIWYLIAPDLGTNNIVVTASGAAYISATALTLNSAHQTTPIGITGDADGSSTAPSVAVVTTQVNSLVIDSVATANDPTTFTAGSGQSIQQSVTSTATRQIATSVESAPALASTTMSYTISPTGNWAITAVEIKGIAGGGGGGSDNYTVKATTNDTTPSFLDDKISLVSTDNTVTITKTINNPGANEDIEYDLSSTGAVSVLNVNEFDDFTSVFTTLDGSTDQSVVSGNFIINALTRVTTELNHPGIVTLGTASIGIYGYGTDMAGTGTVPQNFLISTLNDFTFTTLCRSVRTGASFDQSIGLINDGSSLLNVLVQFKSGTSATNICFDDGSGIPVATAVALPASNTWFEVKFVWDAGTSTLDVTVGGVSVYSGTPTLSSTNIGFGMDNNTGTAGTELSMDYCALNYVVTR